MPVRLSRRRNGAAFTLVELLVVIGIIALLISILLPSLSRARAAANVVKCMSNMRQMGQAMQLYAYENEGYLPWANTPDDPTTADDDDLPRWWANALSYTLGTEIGRLNPIFTDVDTPEADTSWAVFSTEGGEKNHFVGNIRLIPPYPLTWAPGVFPDPFAGLLGLPDAGRHGFAQRRLSSVKNASEVATVWDAAVWTWWNGDAFYTSDGADGWRIWYDHFYVFPAAGDQPGGTHNPDYSRAIDAPNVDFVDGQTQGTVRFRHMRDTVANVLYLDGHVESKKINPVTGRSDFLARELCTSYMDATYVPAD